MVVSMERWVGKVAIVTGASSGIGAAITKKLVEEGVIVVGLARRSDRIEKMAKDLADAKGKLYAIKTDIAKEEEIKNAFRWTLNNLGPIHILVNNAGFHAKTSLLDEHTENWKKTVDINIMGLCIATREAVKIMKDNHIDGHIIHINSVLGHYIFNAPGWDIYPATKYAVTALTETLRMELNSLNSKIKITSISPGAVDTEVFPEKFKKSELFKSSIGENILNPEDIADAAIYVLSTPPHVQVHELTIKPVNEKF